MDVGPYRHRSPVLARRGRCCLHEEETRESESHQRRFQLENTILKGMRIPRYRFFSTVEGSRKLELFSTAEGSQKLKRPDRVFNNEALRRLSRTSLRVTADLHLDFHAYVSLVRSFSWRRLGCFMSL